MNIVAGLTPQPEGRAALARAVEEAERRGAHLHIVRTMGENLSENPARAHDWSSEVAAARSDLQHLTKECQERGVRVTPHLDSVGTAPASRILEVAHDTQADLIVIGLRRRSPVGKLVLGSVSQEVILRADCPVLAVKAQ